MYSWQVKEQLSHVNCDNASTYDKGVTVQKVNEIRVICAQKAAPIKNVERHRKAKLTVYTPAI